MDGGIALLARECVVIGDVGVDGGVGDDLANQFSVCGSREGHGYFFGGSGLAISRRVTVSASKSGLQTFISAVKSAASIPASLQIAVIVARCSACFAGTAW